jgi:RNase P subunit RPR2
MFIDLIINYLSRFNPAAYRTVTDSKRSTSYDIFGVFQNSHHSEKPYRIMLFQGVQTAPKGTIIPRLNSTGPPVIARSGDPLFQKLNGFRSPTMTDPVAEAQHFWELAVRAAEISPELSKGAVMEMLETLRYGGQDPPHGIKKLVCLKCFSIFTEGKNCKTVIRSPKKHPNLKILEYHCLECGNVQRVNHQRVRAAEQLKPEPLLALPQKTQQRRKLMMDLFS